jgi:hypothetical protein
MPNFGILPSYSMISHYRLGDFDLADGYWALRSITIQIIIGNWPRPGISVGCRDQERR